jgi:hypothetical protein
MEKNAQRITRNYIQHLKGKPSEVFPLLPSVPIIVSGRYIEEVQSNITDNESS